MILDKETKSVTLPSGSALSFKCDVNTTGFKRFIVKWFFSRTPDMEPNMEPLNRSLYKNMTSLNEPLDILLNHTEDAKEENSGWYFCNVFEEIPEHRRSTTNRTKVTIGKYLEFINLVRS